MAFLRRPSKTYPATPKKIASTRREIMPGGSVNGSQDGSPGKPNVLLSMYARKAPAGASL